jgi:hypothetical protein
MSTTRASFLVLAVAAVCVAGPAAEEKKEKKGRGTFTVGKETTHVTGPLDKDGYPDYAAALNERLREGVTPDNNANVLLWKAIGPRPEGRALPPELFRMLGVEPPPEKGDYFIGLSRYVEEHLKLDPRKATVGLEEQLGHACERPWTAKEQPHLAAWLKANEKPLALAVEASRRPHYFWPLRGTLLSALLPGVSKCRELTNALAARALLRVAEGDADGAWQDLLACHRLGRLVGRGGTLIEALVGMAIDGLAARADLAFLAHGKLDAKRLTACLRDLEKLPPLPAVADKLDLIERFSTLETALLIDRHGARYLEGLTADRPKEPDPVVERALQGIAWDGALRNINLWYDRVVAAVREPDRPAREKKLADIEAELKAMKARLTAEGALARMLGDASADARGKVIGEVVLGLMAPAFRKVQSAADRAGQTQDNLQVAFALAAHRAEHGRYPKELDALAPAYLARVPPDLFSGKPLIYRPGEGGYLLYSVGPNGKDEGGRGPKDEPPGDDLAVRMPPTEPRRE